MCRKKIKIEEVIKNKRISSTLKKNSKALKTNSLSLKTSQAREALINQKFSKIFIEELKSLRKSHLQIDLSFGTSKGKSELCNQICNNKLIDILSEGEQKAIALSEFLTELQLDNIKAPVVFDDPVNSLDHKIIDLVAKRLMRLSGDRQVIILTHSILLFNNLLDLSSKHNYKSLKSEFYNVKKEFGKVGVITKADEEIKSVSKKIKKINNLLNSSKDRSETDILKEAYGHLRSAIELCVEHEIFEGTVKRYQKNIVLSNLIKVRANKLEEHKESLNDIFERSCGFINAHSNPAIIDNDPTPEGFNIDFKEFKKIREDFLK